VLLRLDVPTVRLPLLPLAVGLAAVDAIHTASGLNADLRWPNDLLIGDRKTGGILVESKTDGDGLAFAVAGIGINVHQSGFDVGLATPATSLDIESGRLISRQALLVALLESLEREATGLVEQDAHKRIPARIENASTWIRGRQVEVHGPQACIGVTAGLDDRGFLLVKAGGGLIAVRTGGIREVKTG
jgi:BirA family biotin operon repressor/biotin-[acetyl-CoA-carboxylase] ligase